MTRFLLPEHSFTPGIEGPACDEQGNVYAVNFQRQGTIGVVTPQGQGYVYVELPAGSVGNGIRFDSQGQMLIADFEGHQILKVDRRSRQVSVHAVLPGAHQPNDLCILADDTVFASDPDWKAETGRVWRVTASGEAAVMAEGMGTTNGIEPSPDEKTLYVNESAQRRIWAFDITPQGLSNKRLFIEFPDHGLDGMRCDVDGMLWVTRYGKGTVVSLDPQGKVLQEIKLLGSRPSNLCFGGEDGCTVYVTEVDHGTLEVFRASRPGREFELWKRVVRGGWDC